MGAFFSMLGAGLLYFSAVGPLQEAMNHTRGRVRLSAKGTIVGFVCFLFGVALLLGGRRVRRFFNPKPEESKIPTVIASVVLVTAGIGAYVAIKLYIESLGYVFNF